MDQLLHAVQAVYAFWTSSQLNFWIGSVISTGAVDIVLRLVKTDKPIDVMRLIGSFLTKLGDVFDYLGKISRVIGSMIDRVIPPRLKSETPPADSSK